MPSPRGKQSISMRGVGLLKVAKMGKRKAQRGGTVYGGGWKKTH